MRESMKAVYGGSFDPVTKGHLWMIEETLKLFDDLVIAVGINPQKRYMFDASTRAELLRGAICEKFKWTEEMLNFRIRIMPIDNDYLVNFARAVEAKHMVRGIRGVDDVPFEMMMRNINGDMAPEISTVFLMPPRDIADVSSSLVKGLVGPKGWTDVVSRYVTSNVMRALEAGVTTR